MYNGIMQRMGRSLLLQASVAGAVFSLLAVGFGLDNRYLTVVSVFIVTFVMSFAVGLGPVPFVLIPEVSPVHVSVFRSTTLIFSHTLKAVSALSSVGLSVNCTCLFLSLGLINIFIQGSRTFSSASFSYLYATPSHREIRSRKEEYFMCLRLCFPDQRICCPDYIEAESLLYKLRGFNGWICSTLFRDFFIVNLCQSTEFEPRTTSTSTAKSGRML
jgi:hypothetical protein